VATRRGTLAQLDFLKPVKFTVAFGFLGLLCLLQVPLWESVPAKLLSFSFAVAFGGVALAYAGIGARVFLKRADGRLHPLSFVLFWPYHLLNVVSLYLFRWLSKENPVDEVAPNLLLGRRLTHRESEQWLDRGVVAVLDLTCEFSETSPFRERTHYRCLPVLDTKVPTRDELDETLVWLKEQTDQGVVFVHCALGHGRSAMVVATYLLHTNEVASVEDAIRRLTEVRPKIGLSPSQIDLLHQRRTDFR